MMRFATEATDVFIIHPDFTACSRPGGLQLTSVKRPVDGSVTRLCGHSGSQVHLCFPDCVDLQCFHIRHAVRRKNKKAKEETHPEGAEASSSPSCTCRPFQHRSSLRVAFSPGDHRLTALHRLHTLTNYARFSLHFCSKSTCLIREVSWFFIRNSGRKDAFSRCLKSGKQL